MRNHGHVANRPGDIMGDHVPGSRSALLYRILLTLLDSGNCLSLIYYSNVRRMPLFIRENHLVVLCFNSGTLIQACIFYENGPLHPTALLKNKVSVFEDLHL